MPVNQSMMTNMKRQYGTKKGEQVYYAMENKMKSKKGSKKAVLKHKLSKMYSK